MSAFHPKQTLTMRHLRAARTPSTEIFISVSAVNKTKKEGREI
jgi:hypothetical protein